MKNSYIYFTAVNVKYSNTFDNTLYLTKALFYKGSQLMGGLEPLTSTLSMWCFFKKKRAWSQ